MVFEQSMGMKRPHGSTPRLVVFSLLPASLTPAWSGELKKDCFTATKTDVKPVTALEGTPLISGSVTMGPLPK